MIFTKIDHCGHIELKSFLENNSYFHAPAFSREFFFQISYKHSKYDKYLVKTPICLGKLG